MNQAQTMVESLGKGLGFFSPEQWRKFKETFKEFAISKMISAAVQNDAAEVKDLAEMAGIPSTEAQDLYSVIADSGVKDLFKLLQGLGYSIFAEKGYTIVALTEPYSIQTGKDLRRKLF